MKRLLLIAASIALYVLWLVSQLPYRWLLIIGAHVGPWLARCDVKSYRAACVNIQRCFPELSFADQQLLLKRNYASLGIALFESALAWWASDHRIKNLLTIEGLEYITELQHQGRGVVVISMHTMSLELVGRLISQVLPVTITYRVQKKNVMESITQRARSKHFFQIIERNKVRSIIRALENKAIVFYAGDVDVGRKGQFINFFNIPASTSDAPLRYAVLTGAGIAMASFYRKPEGGYHLQISPAFEKSPSGDTQQDLRAINLKMENAIRVHPEQYLWQYRRFKTQPQEGFYFYDA